VRQRKGKLTGVNCHANLRAGISKATKLASIAYLASIVLMCRTHSTR